MLCASCTPAQRRAFSVGFCGRKRTCAADTARLLRSNRCMRRCTLRCACTLCVVWSFAAHTAQLLAARFAFMSTAALETVLSAGAPGHRTAPSARHGVCLDRVACCALGRGRILALHSDRISRLRSARLGTARRRQLRCTVVCRYTLQAITAASCLLGCPVAGPLCQPLSRGCFGAGWRVLRAAV